MSDHEQCRCRRCHNCIVTNCVASNCIDIRVHFTLQNRDRAGACTTVSHVGTIVYPLSTGGNSLPCHRHKGSAEGAAPAHKNRPSGALSSSERLEEAADPLPAASPGKSRDGVNLQQKLHWHNEQHISGGVGTGGGGGVKQCLRPAPGGSRVGSALGSAACTPR